MLARKLTGLSLAGDDDDDTACSQTTMLMNFLAGSGDDALCSLPDAQLLPDEFLAKPANDALDQRHDPFFSSHGPDLDNDARSICSSEDQTVKEERASPFSDAPTTLMSYSGKSEISVGDGGEREDFDDESPIQERNTREKTPLRNRVGLPTFQAGMLRLDILPRNNLEAWTNDGDTVAASEEAGREDDHCDTSEMIVRTNHSLFGMHGPMTSPRSSQDDAQAVSPFGSPGSATKRMRPQPVCKTQFVESLGHEVTGVMLDKMRDLATLIDMLEREEVLTRKVRAANGKCDNFFKFDELTVHDVPLWNNAIREMIFREGGPWIDYRGPGKRPTRRVYDCFNYCGVSPARRSRGPPEHDPALLHGEQDFLYCTHFTFSQQTMLANSYRMSVNAHEGGARQRVARCIKGKAAAAAKRARPVSGAGTKKRAGSKKQAGAKSQAKAGCTGPKAAGGSKRAANQSTRKKCKRGRTAC